MALIDKYAKYLHDEQIEKEAIEKQMEIPKELRTSVERVQVTQPIANIVNEFISILPSKIWRSFPGNTVPSIRYNTLLHGSIETDSHFEWYSQIRLNDKNPKSIYIEYDNHTTYYWEKGINFVKCLSNEDEKRKKRKTYKREAAFEDSAAQLQLHYENFKNNYFKLINEYGCGLSQEYILCNYYYWLYENQYPKGNLLIFRDGNIYDWRVNLDYKKLVLFNTQDGRMRDMDKKYPLNSAEIAEKFFLDKLKLLHEQNFI